MVSSAVIAGCRWGCRGRGESRKTPQHHRGKRKTWAVTEDRGVEDSGRRHQMGEREVGCCHYPWEDRCGPRLRPSFTGSHLENNPHIAREGRDICKHLQACVCTHEATHSDARSHTHTHRSIVTSVLPLLGWGGVKQTNYAVVLQLNWRLEGCLKWIMNTIIFPSILDLPCSSSSLKHRHNPCYRSQSVCPHYSAGSTQIISLPNWAAG